MKKIFIFSIGIILVFAGGAFAEDFYKKGVEAYLNGDMGKAARYLETALAEDPGNDKAKSLLQKTLTKLGVSAPKKAPVAMPEPRPKPTPEPKVAPVSKPVVVKAPAPKPRPKPKPKPKPKEEEKEKAKEDVKEAMEPEKPAEKKTATTVLVGAGILIVVGLFLGVYVLTFQTRNVKNLIAQNESLRETLKREQSDRSRLISEREVDKKAEKKAEELFMKWKEREARNRPAPPPPAVPVLNPVPVEPVRVPVSVPRQEMSRKKKIISTLADIPNAKRRAAWDQIASEMENIHRLNPTEAARLFRDMSADPNPWVRAGMAGALRAVADTESVQMLIKLVHDPEADVQREALKQIKSLTADADLAADQRKAIDHLLEYEVEVGEWII